MTSQPREWYIIDCRSNRIVNCVTTYMRERAEECLELMDDSESLRLDPDPPLSMLEQYEYWSKRP